MFNFIGNVLSELKHQSDESWQDATLKTVEGTLLAGVCAYAGTYFFTHHRPLVGAGYVGTIALVSQIAYRGLEALKQNIDISFYQRIITGVQLLQVPFFCYLFNGLNGEFLSAATKMEIITATAYFAAIPIFIHLGINAWTDPTDEHIGSAMGVMLPLASGLLAYAGRFK